MFVHVTRVSGNAKTGPIPVTTSSRDTCPSTCPLFDKGCYAKSGPLALHWRKVTSGERGTDWQGLCDFVESLPNGQLWRHNQAGDLPHNDGVIDGLKLFNLVVANNGKRGFTYTHHNLSDSNLRVIKAANHHGFTVNVSANSIDEADTAVSMGLPATVIVSSNCAGNFTSPDGNRVVVCPAQTNDKITCKDCGLCSQAKRNCIVAFKAHGNAKRYVNSIVS